MKNFRRFCLLGLLFAVALMLASCAGSGASQQQENNSSESAQEESQGGEMTGMDMGSGSEAPAMLVQNGDYSDERFIDMMVPHHQMAIDMAKVAQQNAEHQEIKELADNVVSTQQQEIDQLKSIREQRFGSSSTPSQMNHSEMENMGMLMPDELATQQPFDKAFIDSMIPHHASAIDMASVANMRSDDPEIRGIARAIIDAQSKEIGEMIGWREQWYPEGA
ncbi:MAG: hypothetical protein QOI57_831 [Rubrobacteraceae bacterium]|nr:hypothetical protein [Rubrobacteraceae bacterium]